jgi:hypothetical protein
MQCVFCEVETTNSVERIPHPQTVAPATQESPSISLNRKVHYRVQNSLTLVCIPSHPPILFLYHLLEC